ncbi:hypothetical protein [Pontibacillus sp. HMF3514]|nr:hypothetical protein [Pontibacillus sp. HMF3514]
MFSWQGTVFARVGDGIARVGDGIARVGDEKPVLSRFQVFLIRGL